MDFVITGSWCVHDVVILARQSTAPSCSDLLKRRLKQGREITSLVMTTPGMAEVLMKVQSGNELDPKETFLRNLWSQNVLRGTESFYLNWKSGFLSDSLWESRRAGIKMALAIISKEWWEISQVQFEQDFVEMIDESWKEAEINLTVGSTSQRDT